MSETYDWSWGRKAFLGKPDGITRQVVPLFNAPSKMLPPNSHPGRSAKAVTFCCKTKITHLALDRSDITARLIIGERPHEFCGPWLVGGMELAVPLVVPERMELEIEISAAGYQREYIRVFFAMRGLTIREHG